MSGDAASMRTEEGIFTRYLRGLDEGGAPPNIESFETVKEALRRALRRELARRGLWQLPPGYLGIHGHEQWSRARTGDALDELTADGYVFVFIDRIASLRSHLRLKPNVDGLVFRNVRNFVHELQRRYDPLGTRAFNVLHGAVSQAAHEGDLHVAEGHPAVRNDTVLVFELGESSPVRASEDELRDLVGPWMETLLPDLVTTRGKGHAKLLDKVRGLLLGLADEGVAAFVFGHLAGVFKTELRGRWAAVFEPPVAQNPDTGYEERESLHQLIDCIERERASLGIDEKTASFLRTLWEALRSWACDPASAGEDVLDPGKIPSQREVARVLGIPRDRLPGLYEMLGGIVRACRAAVRSAATEDEAKMDHDERWNRLRQATGEAVARAAEAEREAARPRRGAARAPRPGDVYLLRASAGEAVEWVVLEVESKDRVFAVPADTHPLAGSADAAVAVDVPGGPLTLRCAHGVALPAALFEPELRSRQLAPESLGEARRRAAGERSAERREVDFDPEYKEEQEETARAVRAVVDVAGSHGTGSAGLSDHEVTRLLQSWSAGSIEALDEMLPLVFDDLHRLACYFFQREPDSHTLQPTALINLLYLRLRGTKNTEWANREDFFHFAAGLMRHLLVDYARRRRSQKRGGEMVRFPLSVAAQMPVERDFDVLALDMAIEELKEVDERQGRIVELRYFVGLSIAEVAELEEVSEATVKRELRTAKFWLRRRLNEEG